MLTPRSSSSRRARVLFAVFGMLLPACQKRESEPKTQEGGPAAADKQAPEAPGLKLDDPQVAFDFLEQSGLKLQETKDDCALLAEEHGTLGVLVRKSRRSATQKSIQCESTPGSRTWSCEAEFIITGGGKPEAAEFSESALKLRFNVDDTTRSIPPESLVCLMAG